MLTKKIVSSSMALALTASVAMLSGCPAPTDPSSPSPSGSATTSPTSSATTSPSESPSSSATTSPSSSASATSSPSTTPSNTTPSGDVGVTPDISTRTTIDGKVFDRDGFAVDGVTITATLLDTGASWEAGKDTKTISTTTINGAYVFRNAPVGTRIELKATKDGWTSRSRTESVKSNLQGNTEINKFDFGGVNNLFLQDEPQVEMVKINGTQLTRFGGDIGKPSDTNRPASGTTAAITGINPEDITIELTFTEAMKASSVQNNLRIYSESTSTDRVEPQFTLTETNFDWTWSSDGKVATAKMRKALLAENTGEELRYSATFLNAFEDKDGVNAIGGSFFKFGDANQKDFFTYSVKNDTVDPKLLSVENFDTGTKERLNLRFSESFDVYGKRAEGVTAASTYTVTRMRGGASSTAFGTPSVTISSDGKTVTLEYDKGGVEIFQKDDIVTVEVVRGTDILKDPAGRSFATSDTGKVESIETTDYKKVFRVTND